jgi:isopenicillin N synthase-like dioxygenase
MLDSLPILDLSQLDAGPDAAASFRDALRRATHEVGFFYLTGTGIPRALEERMLSTSRAFFALPEADKLTIENTNSPHFRGYTRLGGERTLGAVDWRDICPEGTALSAAERAGKPAFARLVGPNQWPDALPALRPVVEEWTAFLSGIAHKLLRAWAEALGEAPTFFDETFGEPFTLLKIVRYPETEGTDQGVGSHKDAGVLTLLWIEEGKTGLQVEHGGGWIDAPPAPGALVVNIGEMLEYATQVGSMSS